MKKRHRSYNYKFTEKTHSPRGMAACLLALGSIAGGMVVILKSYHQGGNVSTYLASLGMLLALVAVAALFLSAASLREEERYRIFPGLGLGFSILALAGWVGIYVLGWTS